MPSWKKVITSGSAASFSSLNVDTGITGSDVRIDGWGSVSASLALLNTSDGTVKGSGSANYITKWGSSETITNSIIYQDGTNIGIGTTSPTTKLQVAGIISSSVINVSDPATSRTNLGVDPAGTDNSINVTLVTSSYDYLSINGQEITLGLIDISDHTNLTPGSSIDLVGDTISVDVTGFLSNGVNNRVITATGPDGMNAEANLTFDGSTLYITGNIIANSITGSILATNGVISSSNQIDGQSINNPSAIYDNNGTPILRTGITPEEILTTLELNNNLTSFNLPTSTSISSFGASLIDDTDATIARNTLGVDPAGTDNSTDVTLVTSSYDYLSITGQEITLGQIDASTDILGLSNEIKSKLNSESVVSGSATQVRSFLNVEDGADVTDSLNVVSSLVSATGITNGDKLSIQSNIGVDPAGTDNSTDVTLVTSSYDYLTLSGQEITLGQIDAGTDILGLNEEIKSKLNTDDVVSGSATQVRSFLNVEDGADVTDSLNVVSSLVSASSITNDDKSTIQLNLGVDPTGTDNSTDVTLVTSSYDYLTLSGQEITLGQIDASTDISNLTTTNVTEGSNLYYTDQKVKNKLNIENVISSSTQISYPDISNIPLGIISSSNQFNNILSPFTGSFTGSFTGDGSGLTGLSLVSSVGGTGTVNGLTLTGTVTTSGSLTLGGTLTVNNTNWSGANLSLANGGTGASLSDPNADRILFWDDSSGAVTWLTVGTGLSISGTTITATSAGSGTIGGSGTSNYIPKWSNSNTLTNSVLYNNGSRVGIGTASPLQSLHVVGSIYATGPITGSKIWVNDGGNSVFIGHGAGKTDNATDNRNVGVGYQSLTSNTSGSFNSAVGYETLFSNNTGQYNSTLGYQSLYSNTTGIGNSSLGFQSLFSNTTGTSNVALGLQTLVFNTTGQNNTATGYYALYNNTTGNSNTALGYQAGGFTNNSSANQTSTNSIYLGFDARPSADGNINEIVIGYQGRGHGSNTVTIGNSNITLNYFYNNISGSDIYINEWNSVSASLAILSSSAATIPTLQQVTDQGNTITNDLIVTGSLNINGGVSSTSNISGSDIYINEWNSVSASLAILSSSAATIPTLQQVTDQGNTTSTNVIIGGSLIVTGSTLIKSDLTVEGIVTAREFHTEFVSASILYESGSTKFGDTNDDKHQFTGSIQQSGSNSYFLGNIGIGTTTPSQKLSVEIQKTTSSPGPVINSYPIADFIVAGSTGGLRGLQIGGPEGSVTAPVYLKVAGTGNRFSIVNQNNTENFTILDNGYTGIGVSSPSEKLHVAGNISGSDVYINQWGSVSASLATLQGNSVDGTGTANYISKWSDSNTLTNSLIYDNGTNVGIGTSSPLTTFHAKGNFIRLEELSAARTLDIYPAVSGVNHRFTSTTTGAGYDFENSTGLLLRINSNGNVGIGTSSPTEKLHVVGNIYATGHITGSKIDLNDGGNSVYVGDQAGRVDIASGNQNVGIGYASLNSNTTGDQNTATGHGSLYNNTTGNQNTATGRSSLNSNTVGTLNTGLGAYALRYNTSGSNNTAVGHSSLYTTRGSTNNVAVGFASLYFNTTGGGNTAIGYAALYMNGVGSSNTALGFNAGRYINNGGNNTTVGNGIFIGYDTRALADGGSNEVVIGYEGRGHGSNTVTIGNTSTTTNYFYNDITTTGDISGTAIEVSGGTTSNKFYSANISTIAEFKPSDTRTGLQPIFLYRSTVNGSANYMLVDGTTTRFGTYDSGVPSDVSGMISIAPNNTSEAPVLSIGDAGSNAAALNVGGNIKLLNDGISYINGGNVGIGTTSPSEKLHVVGNISGSDVYINQWGSVSASLATLQGTSIDGTGTANYISKWSDSNTLTNSLVYDNGTNVGIGTTTPSYKLDINGSLRATSITETSARRFKENIKPLENQLNKVNLINPVSFNWKEDKREDIGFIAEDVEKIYPELVSYQNDEIQGIQYSKLTAILVKALQEQQQQIDELKQQIFILKQK